eukprot:TRINITY_DN53031_c0_g2_i2.p3 TRINITY_DN53031_c0_g2~~TRINITY_DN53031_c0_g2_i2.p3  ORF type:complete len:344 (+),score=79.04 TRINITY_DN53031_c0_g2_i2:53-1033(+)
MQDGNSSVQNYGMDGMGGAGMGGAMNGPGSGPGFNPRPSGGYGRGGGRFSYGMGGGGGGAPGAGGGPGGGGGGSFMKEPEFREGKIFLGGLESSITKHELESYCSQWGQVSDSIVMESRGFGFITFEDPKCAQAFLEYAEHRLAGKPVEAKAALPKHKGGNVGLTKKMFVGGLPKELTDEEFSNYFGTFGQMDDCAIVRDPSGTSRGFGFITYQDEISVEKCLVQKHAFYGRLVDVKRAVPRDAYNAQFAAGRMRGGMGGYGYGMGGGMGGYGMGGGMGGYGMGGYGMGMGGMGGYDMGGMGGGFGGMGGGYGGRGRGGPNRYRPY